MKSMRIINMRSLVDTKEINLKSINMLVGSNSSGKSTFLRVFPLLKQSFFRRINGPILWAGDDEDDVDFGSFKETINKNTQDTYIGLEFTIPYNEKNIENYMQRNYFMTRRMIHSRNRSDSEVKLMIEISNKENNDIISKIRLKCKEDELYIDEENGKSYINGKEIKNRKNREEYTSFMENGNSILSNLFIAFDNRNLYRKMQEIIEEAFNIKEEDDDDNYLANSCRQFLASTIAIELFKNNKLSIEEFVDKIENEILKDQKVKERISDFVKIKFNKEVLKCEENISYFKTYYMNEVGRSCIDYIERYFKNVNYVKPVRAHAERYYRLRNLSVDQVDSDGRNLPIFINSLSKENLEKYNNWIYQYFDFKVIPIQTDGHVSINIQKSDKKINLSDTGYGYSQLLPIITQLWVILNMQLDERLDIPIVLAIEQPELHLHPSLQAKLIDVICNIAQNHKGRIQFILETHSETMINRLGNLVYKHKISEEEVNIIVFDKELGEEDTKVSVSKFDKEGYLQNWPIGFFSVDNIE